VPRVVGRSCQMLSKPRSLARLPSLLNSSRFPKQDILVKTRGACTNSAHRARVSRAVETSGLPFNYKPCVLVEKASPWRVVLVAHTARRMPPGSSRFLQMHASDSSSRARFGIRAHFPRESVHRKQSKQGPDKHPALTDNSKLNRGRRGTSGFGIIAQKSH